MTYIFVSYASADREFVARLIPDLQKADITVWIDQLNLKTGTPDWEQALRSAISQASAVLLIATPQSLKSQPVSAELAIASMYQIPVYPVWAEGKHWVEAITMDRFKSQYIDARGEKYSTGLATIIATLGGQGITPAVPESIAPPTTLEVAVFNPYKGLRAFTEQDAPLFFGRERFVTQLIDKLDETLRNNEPRLLAVIGASGSGKSSVLMAGLLPKLRKGALADSQSWVYLPPFVPGAHPLESLSATLTAELPSVSMTAIDEDLRNPNGRGLHRLAGRIGGYQRLVLYIDQFEELFTQTTDEAERAQLISLLTTAITEPDGHLIVLLTLRADFYDRPLNYPELGALMDAHSISILPMALAEVFDAVQKPATAAGLTFDEGLAADLVFEVREQPGSLPLLQFALDQLYKARTDRRLTRSAYDAIGGVRGALAKHAEAVYAGLDSDEDRLLARTLFLRLIEPGTTDQETVRRRASFSELVLTNPAKTDRLGAVTKAFVDARLLVTNRSGDIETVEVAHEALIREWARLEKWLEESREDIRLHKSISAATTDWVRRGRHSDDGALYRGSVLEQAQAWAVHNLPSADESAFLEQSEFAQVQRQTRETLIARRVQNFQRASLVLLMMVVLAVGAIGVALRTVGIAQGERDLASTEVASRATQIAEQIAAGATDVANQVARVEQLRYDSALTILDQALSLTTTGNLYRQQYQLAQALNYYDQALNIIDQVRAGFEQYLPPADAAEATVRISIAAARIAMGQNTAAREELAAALELAPERDYPIEAAKAHHLAGKLEALEGNYLIALDQFADAYDGYQRGEAERSSMDELSIDQLDVAFELGQNYRFETWERDEDFAIASDIEALASRYSGVMKRIILGMATPFEDPTRVIATLLREELPTEYASLVTEIHPNLDKTIEVRALLGFGRILNWSGEYEQAQTVFNEALALAEGLGYTPLQLDILVNLGLLSEGVGDFSLATNYYEQAVSLIESVSLTIRVDAGIVAFREQYALPFQRLVDLLVDVNPQRAFELAEQEHGSALIYEDAVQTRNIILPESDLQEWLSLRQRSQDLYAQYEENLRRRENEPNQFERNRLLDANRAIIRQITDLEIESRQLIEQVDIARSALGTVSLFDNTSVEVVQALLDEDEMLLRFYIEPTSSVGIGTVYVFLFTQESFEALQYNLSPDDLAFLAQNVADASSELDREALVALYNSLIAPIVDRLDKQQLIIVSDRILDRLPFGALTPDGLEYFGDTFSISYMPSATIFSQLTFAESLPTLSFTGSALVMANPTTYLSIRNSDGSQASLPALFGAESEAESLARLLEVSPLIRDSATESSFWREAENVDVIHIAAHRVLDPENMFASALALASDEDNDGSLQIREIVTLDFNERRPIVVLSTGICCGVTTDSSDSFVPVFLAGGARAVVTSRWIVYDEATQALMTCFYENLLSGMEIHEALWYAQEYLRTQTEWTAPIFWGGWVVNGLPS